MRIYKLFNEIVVFKIKQQNVIIFLAEENNKLVFCVIVIIGNVNVNFLYGLKTYSFAIFLLKMQMNLQKIQICYKFSLKFALRWCT